MAASDGSFVGVGKQVAKGTPFVTDAGFKYLLFNEGGIAPVNMTVPLDTEVGGGAMLRDVNKMGVMSGGQFAFVPRPETLGTLLLGTFGSVVTTGAGPSYSHAFSLPADQFAAPYFTFRSAPANLWGEQFQDCRIAGLGLTWRGANYVRGQFAVQGGLPSKVSTAAWAAAAKVDSGPQFIAPVSTIELPTATAVKVLGGSFQAGLGMPMDEQWVVGSYSPDDFDITSRSFAISFLLKITDATLYSKMTYDPQGGSAWAASLFREANFKLELNSNVLADVGKPYSLTIAANGQSGDSANVIWSASPVGMRAGRQIVLNVSGVFTAATTGVPITATLVNKTVSY